MRLGLLVALVLAACAPRLPPIANTNPANPNADSGRLAGPPPALRPGVVTVDAPPAPSQPAPRPAPSGHEGHH